MKNTLILCFNRAYVIEERQYLAIRCTFFAEHWKKKSPSLFHRQADGRKVLRSSIREFLCSEAMFFLGVPTTRAGSVVTSDSRVIRDVYYNGNARPERCSVVLRIAPTFIRWVHIT